MIIHLQSELNELRKTVLTMASLVKESLEQTISALSTLDSDLAQNIIDGDYRINELEVKIDEMCLKLLALEGPVAKDLRFIVGAMRASVDLERIGDESANICEAIIPLSLRPSLPLYMKLEEIGEKSFEMLENSIISFVRENPDLATDVCKMDWQVDDLNSKIIKETIEFMRDSSPAIESCIQVINIARRFERIADLATNIAESAVFIAKGINIKHYCQFDNRR